MGNPLSLAIFNSYVSHNQRVRRCFWRSSAPWIWRENIWWFSGQNTMGSENPVEWDWYTGFMIPGLVNELTYWKIHPFYSWIISQLFLLGHGFQFANCKRWPPPGKFLRIWITNQWDAGTFFTATFFLSPDRSARAHSAAPRAAPRPLGGLRCRPVLASAGNPLRHPQWPGRLILQFWPKLHSGAPVR